MRQDANEIIRESIQKVLPDEAVKRALDNIAFHEGKIYLVSTGKAAWQMARAACEYLGDKLHRGIVVTKYGHVKGEIPKVTCYEGGHPVPDDNSFIGTQAAIDLVSGLAPEDNVLFLLSGGGSALFEKPLIPGGELADITRQLLSCGAGIVEMNIIRKRLSAVKGGRFAEICSPAHVFSIVLSDILGDPLDMIASGPAYPDPSTCAQAAAILQKYDIKISEKAGLLLSRETPKELKNVETQITGSVRELCAAAAESCSKKGYKPMILTDRLNCEAREAGAFLSAIALTHGNTKENLAFIAGGETVVHLTGSGKGGRNQEIALAAAEMIGGASNISIFSVGSDGTDGPTDAAGGYVDGKTKGILKQQGISIYQVLRDNDAYHALQKAGGLIITGATGTNVNDVSVVLVAAEKDK